MEQIDHTEADSAKEGGGLAKVSLLIMRRRMIPDSQGICCSAIKSEGAIERTRTAVTHNLRINPYYKSSSEGSCPVLRKPVALSHVGQGRGVGDFMLEQY